MDAKEYLISQEQECQARRESLFERFLRTPDGSRFLATSDGREYQEASVSLGVIRKLIAGIDNVPDTPQAPAIDVTADDTVGTVKTSSPVINHIGIRRTRTLPSKAKPARAAAKKTPRKSQWQIIANMIRYSPNQTLTLDEIMAQGKSMGYTFKRRSLQSVLTVYKDVFRAVDRGSGRWTLMDVPEGELSGLVEPRIDIEPLKALFMPDIYSGLGKTEGLDGIGREIATSNRENVVLDLEAALYLMEWVGTPIEGESDYHKRQNVSKLLRNNDLYRSVGRGRFAIVDSLPSQSPTFDFDEGERNGHPPRNLQVEELANIGQLVSSDSPN